MNEPNPRTNDDHADALSSPLDIEEFTVPEDMWRDYRVDAGLPPAPPVLPTDPDAPCRPCVPTGEISIDVNVEEGE